ncbi:hypothetical protein Mal52_32880 [Symmachiella dynata]|uniref:Uncharacterized protein n=1 Tax=Symmachiella dynata TaxID=2527995 RepID=A0A517ZQN0_9PLAN|nr:hypothetical protein Mal52_32880 [Symmachiella dynata]
MRKVGILKKLKKVHKYRVSLWGRGRSFGVNGKTRLTNLHVAGMNGLMAVSLGYALVTS